MNKSESIAKFAEAMAAAQGEMENAKKNATNPHFRSNYADLAEVLNTVRPVLSRHGISITQFPSYGDGLVHVETIIAHKSGEWMSEKCSAPAQKQDPQGVGSAISYLRRYSLAAVCGLAQEDDDAQAAVKPKTKPVAVQHEPPKKQTDAPLTDSQRKQLMVLYKDAPREVRIDDANELFQQAKPGCKRIESFSELTERQAAYLITQLEKLRAA
jgi:hypothetical protein